MAKKKVYKWNLGYGLVIVVTARSRQGARKRAARAIDKSGLEPSLKLLLDKMYPEKTGDDVAVIARIGSESNTYVTISTAVSTIEAEKDRQRRRFERLEKERRWEIERLPLENDWVHKRKLETRDYAMGRHSVCGWQETNGRGERRAFAIKTGDITCPRCLFIDAVNPDGAKVHFKTNKGFTVNCLTAKKSSKAQTSDDPMCVTCRTCRLSMLGQGVVKYDGTKMIVVKKYRPLAYPKDHNGAAAMADTGDAVQSAELAVN